LVRDVHNQPKWNTIIIYDYSRLSRNLEHSINYSNDFEDLGVKIISVTQPYGDTNEGRFMRNMTFAQNEYYAKDCAKRISDSLTIRAKKGQHCGGKPPLGYDVSPEGRLVINEKEAVIVQEIFNMYEHGYSYSQIIEELTKKGYTNRNGKPFVKNSFTSILNQEKYTGTYVWNKVVSKDHHGRHNSHRYKDIDKQVRIEGGCPAIISPEQFKRVSDIMHKKYEHNAYQRTRHHYMLSNLKILKCAECGAYMIGARNNSRGKEYDVYFCPNRKAKKCSMPQIKAENLNKLVAGLMISAINKRDDLNEILKEARYNDEERRLQDRIRGKEISIANIVKALEVGFSIELMQRLETLKKEKASLEERYISCKNKSKDIALNNKAKLLKKLGKYFITSSDPDIKLFLKNNIECITIDHNDITIEYIA